MILELERIKKSFYDCLKIFFVLGRFKKLLSFLLVALIADIKIAITMPAGQNILRLTNIATNSARLLFLKSLQRMAERANRKLEPLAFSVLRKDKYVHIKILQREQHQHTVPNGSLHPLHCSSS
jgi:hypothetical protein